MKIEYIIIVIILLLIIIYVLVKNSQLKKSIAETIAEKENLEKKERSTAEELEKVKIENLKFSINPHSFKNTLQTIEHLAKKTHDSVNSLSGIFDYMLYDSKNQFVPLQQELSFASEYLKLYRLRLKPTVIVKKDFNQTHLDKWGKDKKIAPLIFAHFIENAFKHGDLNSPKSFINITIETLDDNNLIYSVRNLISKKPSLKKGGIGNSTFRERLKLLYKDNYEYDHSIKDNVYTANLKLTIYDK